MSGRALDRGRRVLICGSRDWTDPLPIQNVLRELDPINDVVIHGNARGADRVAGRLAQTYRLRVEEYPADWKRLGKAAGPLRNRWMLDDGQPSEVWAFKADFDPTLSRGGTENMVALAREAGIKTTVVTG